MKNIFDWLKAINNTKPPVESFTDKDWEVWNSYMIHRFISMNPDYIELVNFIQDYPPQNKKAIYSIYKEYIPKNNKWNKYIKSNKKLLRMFSKRGKRVFMYIRPRLYKKYIV